MHMCQKQEARSQIEAEAPKPVVFNKSAINNPFLEQTN